MGGLFFSFIFFWGFRAEAVNPESFLQMDPNEQERFLHQETIEVFEPKQLKDFAAKNSELVSRAQRAAEEASQVWGDTILEGPYLLTDDITVEITSLFLKEEHVYALTVVVSAPAVNTDSCEWDGESQAPGEDCTEGSISETLVIGINGEPLDLGYYPDFSD